MDSPTDELLASCYRDALKLAEDNGIRSIAFPAISTGAFGYPMEPAAEIAFATIAGALTGLSSVQHIRFVLFGSSDLAIHERTLEAMENR